MPNPTVHVAVDVSKASLDVYAKPLGSMKLSNGKAGFRRLAKAIDQLKTHCIVCCEATGGYEQEMMNALTARQIPVVRFNPKRVRDYARSQGYLAKTDAIDARVIAEYAATCKDLTPQVIPDYLPTLRALFQRRDQLVQAKLTENNYLEKISTGQATSDIKVHVRFLERRIALIEQKIRDHVEGHPDLLHLFKRLVQVRGIGETTAWAVLALMPELGHISRQAAAALAGVAPYNQDSGQMRGVRRIQGGRFLLRRQLYMCALAASLYNPVLRNIYQRLIRNGKPPKVALVALMRKIIMLMNQIARDPNFVPA